MNFYKFKNNRKTSINTVSVYVINKTNNVFIILKYIIKK